MPPELYLYDVILLHDFLRRRGVDTWIWGDMLINLSESPDMNLKPMYFTSDGYGKKVRDALPRDIVICDWHYFENGSEFPSSSAMVDEVFGFWVRHGVIRSLYKTSVFMLVSIELSE